MLEFGRQLKDLRIRLGLTQADLAKASNLGQSTISALETGRQSPWPSTRRALARACRMPLEEFDAQTMGARRGGAGEPLFLAEPDNGPASGEDSRGSDVAATVLRLVDRLHAAEDRLRQTEKELSVLQRALNRAPVVIWTTDANLRITSAHGYESEILGKPQDLLGARLDEHFLEALEVPKQDFEPLEAHRRALGGAVTTSTAELNGQTFSLIVEPLLNSESAVIGTIGVVVAVPPVLGQNAAVH